MLKNHILKKYNDKSKAPAEKLSGHLTSAASQSNNQINLQNLQRISMNRNNNVLANLSNLTGQASENLKMNAKFKQQILLGQPIISGRNQQRFPTTRTPGVAPQRDE